MMHLPLTWLAWHLASLNFRNVSIWGINWGRPTHLQIRVSVRNTVRPARNAGRPIAASMTRYTPEKEGLKAGGADV